jgi:hypothetical protein
MSATPQQFIADGAQLVVDLLDRGVRLGRGLDLPRLPSASCGCDIPPPCWYPKAAGEVTSHVCSGGTATLRIRITNCGPVARAIKVEGEKDMKVEPAGLQLGPMERGVVTVSTTATDGAEHLIWIHGCHDHFIRWTVETSKRGSDSCHELDVEDCPDYLHHWYDHFYCAHPCRSGQRLTPVVHG